VRFVRRAATRIRASRERSGPCFRCADDEVDDPKVRPASARCDDFRLGAVYTLATRSESRQRVDWVIPRCGSPFSESASRAATSSAASWREMADGRSGQAPRLAAYGYPGQGRWNGSWVRTDGTEWRANRDLLRRVSLLTITRALGPSSSPARSTAARRSSPAQQTGRSWPTPLRYPRFGTQNRPFCHSASHPDNSAHHHNISIPWSSRCYHNNPRPSHKYWNDNR
jgi:hypothetical protein